MEWYAEALEVRPVWPHATPWIRRAQCFVGSESTALDAAFLLVIGGLLIQIKDGPPAGREALVAAVTKVLSGGGSAQDGPE